ncbi:MAG: PKD domain-containing protein [Bacteroidota bacterium]
MNFPARLLLWCLAMWLGLAGAFAQPTGFLDQVYVSGFSTVIGLTFDDNGRMYVWERDGRVFIVDDGIKVSAPIIDLRDEVGGWRDFGLLSVALDPNFLTNGYIYMLYTVDHNHIYNGAAAKDAFAQAFGRITRYTINNPTAASDVVTLDPASRTVLLGETPGTGFPCTHQSHHVGGLVFGTDGTLMATCGDAASYSTTDEGGVISGGWVNQAITDGILQPYENIGAYRSQFDSSLCGKMVRIDPATGDGIYNNPNYDALNPRSPQSRTWALGLRNPCRMTKRPGTGSPNIADADPGVFYIGDVGWGKKEELNICDGPNQNFGWPRYEGMGLQGTYNNLQYDPGTNGIPPHKRPTFDWRGGSARVLKNGTVYNMGASGNPVSGNSFIGNCSMGGIWYTGDDFPASYQNTYFHADYGAGWIQNFSFDANNEPLEVRTFIPNGGPVTGLATSPTTGALYYVNRGSVVRKITYTPDNLPPIAVALSDISYGESPVTVNFRGNRSSDPDGDPITYTWDFGDGSPTSSDVNTEHTFSFGSGQRKFTVMLTVEDDNGSIGIDSVIISLNNTPPTIASTSIDAIDFYSGETNIPLSAIASDREDNAEDLIYEWQTFLFHDNHNHPEPKVVDTLTSTVLSPVGCDGVLYFYRINLKVTDSGGLSANYAKDIYPDCGGSGDLPTARFIYSVISTNPTKIDFNGLSSYDLDGPIVSYTWDFGDGTTGSGPQVSHVFFEPNSYTVRLTVMDTDGNTDDVVSVIPVSCGVSSTFTAKGSIGYETWTGVGGTSLSAIDFDNTLSNTASRRTSFESPTNVLDNYGVRMRGYIHAPQTGPYRLWIASDDNGELFVSTDDDPTNMVSIATVPGWTSSRQWGKYGSQVGTVNLVAGQRYYIEARMKEGGGGDNLAVRWELPDGTIEEPIGANRISPWNGGPYPNMWREEFRRPNGATQDDGNTTWSIDGTNLNASAVFSVDAEEFATSNTVGEGVWESELIDISTESSVRISVDLKSEGTPDPQDYIRIYHKLDGGAEVLVAERRDNFNGDVWETVVSGDVSGSDLQVVVRFLLSGNDETYYMDNVQVISNGSIVSSGLSDCVSCSSTPAVHTALRGQYGSCISEFNNAWLEIQDQYEEALVSIHDENQDLGLVTVETFDHGNEVFAYQDYFFTIRSFQVETEKTFINPVRVKFYLLPSELNTLMAQDPSVNGLADIRIVKYSNGKLGQVGIGTETVITPISTSLGTGPGGSHELEFTTTSFSTFFLRGSAASFPVEWLSFDVEQVGVDGMLRWEVSQTGQESHFEILRSQDGQNFQQIGRMDVPAGQLGEYKYDFVDRNVVSQQYTRALYQLRQVDLDGQAILSPVRILEWDASQQIRARFFPNPARDQVTVRYYLPEETAASLRIVNQIGQVVFSRELSSETGENRLDIDTRSWARGFYSVQLTHQESRISEVLVLK